MLTSLYRGLFRGYLLIKIALTHAPFKGAALTVALVMLAGSASAATVVIDDFESDTLNPQWVQSTVISVGGATGVPTYDTTMNDGKLTYSFTNPNTGAIQTTLLRDDYTLANDGDYFQLTINIPSSTGPGFNLFGGLTIDSGSKSPVDRSGIGGITLSAAGGVWVQQGETDHPAVPGVGSLGSDMTLRITRASATSAIFSYSTDNGVTFSDYGGPGTTFSVGGFNAVGVWNGNARSVDQGSVLFDNLTLTSVPEPYSIVLILGSAIGCAFFRRFKSAALTAILVMLAVQANAATVVIDDFESDTLDSQWVQSTVISVGGPTGIPTYDTTTNDGQLTYSFTNPNTGAVQTTLLRDDYTLAHDGDYFQVSVNIPSVTGPGFNLFGGLMVDTGSKSPVDRSGIRGITISGAGVLWVQEGETDHPVEVLGLSNLVLRITRASATSAIFSYSIDNGATFSDYGGPGMTFSVSSFKAVGVWNGNARSVDEGAVLFDNLTLTTSASLVPGDFDGDGDVDGADFVAWQTNFPKASGATLAEGDADADGDVDGADFVVWQTNFPFTPGPGVTSIPEPHALALGAMGGLIVAVWRFRRR